MDASEIKDRETVQAWLKTRPQSYSIAIANRCAMRATPFLIYQSNPYGAKDSISSRIIGLWGLVLGGIAYNALNRKLAEICERAVLLLADVEGELPRAVAYSLLTTRYIDTAAEYADTAISCAFSEINEFDFQLQMSGIPIALGASPNFTEWNAIRSDALALESNTNPLTLTLWHNSTPPDWFTTTSAAMRTYWQTNNPTHWSFWLRWWDAAVAGNPLDWQLQHDIALIPDDIWQSGPGAVAAAIARIEAAHNGAQSEPSLETQISRLPAPSASQIATTQAAMEHNRTMLPPTFDAIEGLILLEIERLQRLNFKDDLDQAEAHRQIRILTTLYEAICALRAQLPETGPVTEEQAKTSVSLVSLYSRKFADLPRTKVDEVIDGAWATGRGLLQAGLIGTTTVIGVAYGLPALAAVTIGAMVFAPKNAADLVKAARETLTPKA